MYDTIRNTLFININKEIRNFENFSTESKLRILMQPLGKVAVLVTAFVHAAFVYRKATSST